MGNEASHPTQAQPANAKLQNGAPNGHASIPSEDMGEPVACEAAVQQSSELSSLPTKEASPPSVNKVDGGKNHTKDTPPAPKSDAPKDPTNPPISIKSSVEKEASLQPLKPVLETPTVIDSTPKEEKKVNFFKVFKKRNKKEIEKEPTLVECNSPPEDQAPSTKAQVLTNGLHSEPEDVEGSTTVGNVPNGTPAGGEALKVNGEAVHQVDTEEQESGAEDSPVMNFFKTLVTPSKAPKEEGAPPAVPVEEVKVSEEPEPKTQGETGPVNPPADPPMAEPKAPASTVKTSTFSKLFKPKPSSKGAKPETTTKAIQEVDKPMDTAAPKPPPPPPPPEPPKLEVKGELVAKPVNSAQKEAPKDAVKEPEAASKQKPTKGSPFRKLFHPKEEEKQEEEEPQPVKEEEVTEVEETGDSKAKAADVQISPGQSPKAEKKSGKSNLISLFKPAAPKRQSEAGVQTDPVTIIYPAK